MKRIGASVCATLAAAACLAGDLTVDGTLNVNSNLAARSLSATNASLVSVSVASNVVVAGYLVVSNAAAASGGAVVFDPGNAGTNRYGGAVSVLGLRVREGSNTVATGYAAHAEGVGTAASGYASFAGGWNASATNDKSFVWSDGTAVGSTSTNQFTVFALGGIRLLGGPVSGNGSGLTNLVVTNFVAGSISAGALAAGAVTATNLAAGSVGAFALASSAVTSNSIATGSVGTNKAIMAEWNAWGDARYGNQSGSSSGSLQGALLANGTVPMTGSLQMGGNKISDLADAVADTDAVNRRMATNIVQTAIQQALLNVEPQGDVSMGTFTVR